MKKFFTLFLFLSTGVAIIAQAPEKLSFQAVVRNAAGDLVINSNIGFRLQVLKTNEFGAAVFVETQQVTTNENGLAIMQIGNGTAVTGKFDSIDWSKGPYYIKTEMDPAGGTNYTLSGTQQILSVPYALYAKNSALPEGIVKSASQPEAGDLLYYDGSKWQPVTAGDDGQVLTMSGGKPQWEAPFTGNELIGLHEPVLSTIFEDSPTSHNIHMATDGKYYYTINGGNYTTGKISKFTLDGDFIASYPIAIDMRGLMYNRADGIFYVSGFEASTSERNIYKITSIENGTFEKILPNSYDYFQSTAAISEDGQFYYAFNKGILKKYKLSDGTLVDTYQNIEYEDASGAAGAVAVDDQYFYTWSPTTGTIHVYNLDGTFSINLKISNGSFGYSLSVANGYLFVSVDGGSGTGTWYGYNIRRMINPTRMVTNKKSNQPAAKSALLPADDTTIR